MLEIAVLRMLAGLLLMAISASINRDTSYDLAVIAVRVLDDAHMTWVAAQVDSEHALHAWFEADAPQEAIERLQQLSREPGSSLQNIGEPQGQKAASFKAFTTSLEHDLVI